MIELNLATKLIQILPKITNMSLLSIDQLCDDYCIALFHKKILKILNNNKVILEGIWNRFDGLWDVHFEPISTPVRTKLQPQVNVILQKNKSKYELANFYHAALCSPTLTTLHQAINNNQQLSWPAIHELIFSSSFIKTTATALEHLD